MKVIVSSSLSSAAGGQSEFEVEPGTINQILARLGRDYPLLAPIIEDGVAVAVDGVICRGNFTQLVQPDNEVVLLRQITGG